MKKIIAILLTLNLLTSIIGINVYHHVCHHTGHKSVSFSKDELTCTDHHKEISCCEDHKQCSRKHSENCCGHNESTHVSFEPVKCCDELAQRLSLESEFLIHEKTSLSSYIAAALAEIKQETADNESLYKHKLKPIERLDFLVIDDCIIDFIHSSSNPESIC